MSEYHDGDGAGSATITEQAHEKVQETAQQASQKGAEYLRQQTEARAGQVSSELQSVADALRRSGHALHADGKEASGAAVDNVTQTIERLSRYLGQTGGDQMLRDLESFGRKKPWGLIGVGLGLGVAASRFLKASSSNRYQSVTAQPRPATPAAALPPAPSQSHYAEPVTQVGRPVYQGEGR
jgi:ElaB/YqjD/DUF883 family membrane-anchored ribosome-binding protein